ncbi:phytanoyl-CoA dioxygenase family protein [Sphingomonas sp. ID1715]|uniref:phytanoyl-CoA dioxygenase family protein n=1 Tax=Sphingomonas sp. ID1715 TaxID=1656898 RepID=UPI001489841C|nr:phytanoyl-CoA dioxygenase family protein [Sphingomonas sp. ID1715]NNM76490.1 phytanoyl-CoA dioxygenase family protein [Sphingomonas sp. ID1715]
MTPDQRAFYDENGYLLIPSFIAPDEAAALRAEVHAIAARQGPTNATWSSVADQGTVLEHSHDVQFRSAAFTRLLVHPRLIDVFTALIGPNVQLHHNKMFIKPPERGSPFPMHQDYGYFPHRGRSMTAAILHLDDAPDAKGCVRVYPGSHKLGPLDAIGQDHHVDPDRFPLSAAVPVEAKAGDLLVFNYLTVHGSGLNVSDEPRTTWLIQVRDPEDEPISEQHQSRGQGMMLAGIDPRTSAFRFAWQATQ